MYAFDSKNNCWIPLRNTPEYKRKKRFLCTAWIFTGVLMWVLPLYAVLVMFLLGTFLSFMVLDETAYSYTVK